MHAGKRCCSLYERKRACLPVLLDISTQPIMRRCTKLPLSLSCNAANDLARHGPSRKCPLEGAAIQPHTPLLGFRRWVRAERDQICISPTAPQ